MEIFPRDLGTGKRLAIIARRMTPGTSDGSSSRPVTYTDAAFSADDVKPRRGRIMRWLTRVGSSYFFYRPQIPCCRLQASRPHRQMQPEKGL